MDLSNVIQETLTRGTSETWGHSKETHILGYQTNFVPPQVMSYVRSKWLHCYRNFMMKNHWRKHSELTCTLNNRWDISQHTHRGRRKLVFLCRHGVSETVLGIEHSLMEHRLPWLWSLIDGGNNFIVPRKVVILTTVVFFFPQGCSSQSIDACSVNGILILWPRTLPGTQGV